MNQTPIPDKVCPVVLRPAGGARQILAFEHPQAGRQLVKGTIESGEGGAEAALRELREESGIAAARVVAHLGPWEAGHEGQVWDFYRLSPDAPLPARWSFWTADGGGHNFEFFWYPLDEPADHRWHPVFARALAHLRDVLP